MLISHDTEFMNKVVNVIYHLEFTKLSRYSANYEKFLTMADIKKTQHIDAYERQQEHIRKTEDFIQRNKARASTSGTSQEPPEATGSGRANRPPGNGGQADVHLQRIEGQRQNRVPSRALW